MKITDYLYPAKGEQLLPDYSKDEMEEVTITIQNEKSRKRNLIIEL